ncbi:MAG: hypothetical protein GDA54_02120 [Alphaproteobacteria bacterium GM7ARS4]|nr:hypothetical protein [Alphaproteobacteria bacterium GM7ARS4]
MKPISPALIPHVAWCLDETRAFIRLRGPACVTFLQRLITCDVTHVTDDRSAWGALLTPQGRVLYDFFLVKEGDHGMLLECHEAHRESLTTTLQRYRLGAQLTIDRGDLVSAVIFGADEEAVTHHLPLNMPPPHVRHEGYDAVTRRHQDRIFYYDPRHRIGGVRVCQPHAMLSAFETMMTERNVPRTALDVYTRFRLIHTLPQGIPDFESGVSLPLDNNMDSLHAISWDKGCYIGQEVTARIKHRSKRRYHLRCFSLGDLPREALHAQDTTPLTLFYHGKERGTLRHYQRPYGMALIRIDSPPLEGDGTEGAWRYDKTGHRLTYKEDGL